MRQVFINFVADSRHFGNTMKYGYARISTSDQDLEIQRNTLKSVGCEVIREEKVSGTSLKNCSELTTLTEFLRRGDELVVTRIDRLARSIRDLQNIVNDLTEKGVNLYVTEQSINTTSQNGKYFLEMLAVFAEFETRLRHERQMEGIKKAKEKGVYKGRKQTVDVTKIKELASEGLMKTEIARRLGVGRATVYRALGD